MLATLVEDNAAITERSPQETDLATSARTQRATVEERVEQIVADYVQHVSIKPTEEQLAVIREKAKVWEAWDRLRRAYSVVSWMCPEH